MLHAYFDESERDGLLCVSGVAFTERGARLLAREYKNVFGSYGGFHMVDLVARADGYKGISSEERVSLIKEAVRIFGDYFSYGVSVTIGLKEYMEQSPTFMRGLGQAYPFLCHLGMTALVELMRAHREEERIAYVFEAGHAYEAEARDFVAMCAATKELRTFYMHGEDSFVPKADAVPLQAADLLAWETVKFQLETVETAKRKMRLSFLAMHAARPGRIKMHFCKGPRLRKALNGYRQVGLKALEEEQQRRKQ